jgi:hypothetical protein
MPVPGGLDSLGRLSAGQPHQFFAELKQRHVEQNLQAKRRAGLKPFSGLAAQFDYGFNPFSLRCIQNSPYIQNRSDRRAAGYVRQAGNLFNRVFVHTP